MSKFERINKLKAAYLKAPIQLSAERSRLFTQAFKETELEPHVIRMAKGFKKVLEGISIGINPGQLFAGSQTKYLKGCVAYPEASNHWIKNEIASVDKREMTLKVNKKDKEMILEDVKYWEGKSVMDQARIQWREKFGKLIEEMRDARLIYDTGSWQSQGRLIVDYPKVIKKGLKGVIAEAQEELAKTEVLRLGDKDKVNFLKAVIIACEGVINFAKRYAALAEKMAQKEKDPQRKKELKKIAQNCAWVPENPPRDFHEALQSFWFTHLGMILEYTPHGLSPGRFDQYIYPFYKKDIRNKKLTRDQAMELLECLWVKMTEYERFVPNIITHVQHSRYQNIAIGGPARDGSDSTNDLSYLILDATEDARMTQPTISVRYHDAAPERFLLRAAEVLKTGIGMPAFFNSKTATQMYMGKGVPLEDANDWVIAGCVTMSLSGCTVNSASPGFINLAKCLELALNQGVDPHTHKMIGVKTKDPSQFKSYKQLWKAYETQVDYTLDMMCKAFGISMSLASEILPPVYQSALVNDCIKKGKSTYSGGARYNIAIGPVYNGMIDAGNSLAAIKKYVFDEKKMSMNALKEALKVDFKGKERLQQLLLSAPKFGNDDDYVDNIVKDIHKHCVEIAEQRTNFFGEPYMAKFLSIISHYFFGETTEALPSGRKAHEPLADGTLSPSPGTDTHGPTAVIKSAAKVEAAVGPVSKSSLLNQKFHPAALNTDQSLKNLLSLIKSYFDLYGHHIQFNVVSGEMLRAAQKEPEQHKDLIVRVAGFSQFFVKLPKVIQNEIVSRTEQVTV